MQLLIEGGSYSRAAFINFGPILDGVIHKKCSIEGWFSKTALRVIKIRSSKKLPRCSKTKPRQSSVTEQASTLYWRSWPHPLNRVRICVQLLFEGGYYFFRWAPGAATIQGAASIQINTVMCIKWFTRSMHYAPKREAHKYNVHVHVCT